MPFRRRKPRATFPALTNPVISAARTPPEVDVYCPDIIPTYGSEQLTNPGFEGTYVSGQAPNWSFNTGPTYTEEGTIIHGGSAAQKVVAAATNKGTYKTGIVHTANNWVAYSAWIYLVSGGIRQTDVQSKIYNPTSDTLTTPTGEWVQLKLTTRITTTHASDGPYWVPTELTDYYIDDASCKMIDWASMLSSLGSGIYSTYGAYVNVVNNTQAGLLIRYKDASNFIMAIIDRASSDTIRLFKCVAGTYTLVSSYAMTGAYAYSDNKTLVVRVSGTSYNVYFDEQKVISAASITDTVFGKGVYGFSTDSENDIGRVILSTNSNQVPYVIISFDDYLDVFYPDAYDVLVARSLPANVMLRTDSVTGTPPDTWANYQTFSAAGWRICSHTRNHHNISALPVAEAETKITEAHDDLVANSLAVASHYFAYPFGDWSATAMVACANTTTLLARAYSVAAGQNRDFDPRFEHRYHIRCPYIKNTDTLAAVEGWVDTAITNGNCLWIGFHWITAVADSESEWALADFEDLMDYIIAQGVQVITVVGLYAIMEPWFQGG